MKILIIHNPYSKIGGEDSVVAAQTAILRKAGHTVLLYERPYAEINSWRFGRFSSLFSSLYNRRSVDEVRDLVKAQSPDIALIHNLLPVVSPAILPILKCAGITVVMTLHNFRLFCPTGIFFRHGHICEQCPSSIYREWSCLAHKCEGSLLGSFAFALRSFWARKKGYYTQNVDRFLALSDFQRSKFIQYGFDGSKIGVLPNPVHQAEAKSDELPRQDFVAFAGRLNVEKGAGLLIQVARMMPHVEFRVAGATSSDTLYELPDNIKLLGALDRTAMDHFYRTARIIANTSICYETFGLTIAEGMLHGAVAILPNLAAMSELIDGGRVGLIYQAGQADSLRDCIDKVLTNSELSARLSADGARYIAQKYSDSAYLDGLNRQIKLISEIK